MLKHQIKLAKTSCAGFGILYLFTCAEKVGNIINKTRTQ